VHLEACPSFNRQGTQRRRRLIGLTGILFLAVWPAPAARAQERNSGSTSASDLALQNLSRVAASAKEIEAVLAMDAGLMIELKHWVARDATDHGQVLNDLDVTYRFVAFALGLAYCWSLPACSLRTAGIQPTSLSMSLSPSDAGTRKSCSQYWPVTGTRWNSASGKFRSLPPAALYKMWGSPRAARKPSLTSPTARHASSI
jgi:hypothetical protein